MATPWPVSLQQFINVSSFQIQLGDTTVKSSVDTGLAKVRSRYTAAVDVWTTSINLDMTSYQTFVDFFRTTLANGTLPFAFLNPFNSTTETFRFQGAPQISPIGGTTFTVSMVWERLP